MPDTDTTPPPVRLDLIDRGPRWLSTLADCAVEPSDDSEARLRKRSLVMAAAIGATVVLPWAVYYVTLGLGRVAIYPLIFVVVTTLSLIYSSRTKKVGFLLNSQLAMYLILPIFVHVGLGGFANSSGVIDVKGIGAVETFLIPA